MCECKIGMCDRCTMAAFEERMDMRDYALDFIDTYSNEEIAQMVREKILTIEEVEAGLRRRIGL